MGSRDRDTRSLQDKLKVFFKKGASAALPARNELVVTAEMERELGPETPLPRRLRALRELADRASTTRIQEGAVKKLWSCTLDLLEEGCAEARQAALAGVRAVLEAQAAGPADELGLMRAEVLRHLAASHAARAQQDDPHRLKVLHALTCNGKNIKGFEEQIGPFLLEWLPQLQNPVLLVEFLELTMNVVKFNATYLDEDIVHGLVIAACRLVESSAEAGVAGAALALLEAVVSYSWLPRGALPAFVCALCRAVNAEARCQASWKLMRSVLGADIGHAALHQLAALPARPEAARDAGLARGAVFYMNMALWGPCRVRSLHVSCLAVLPALLHALRGGRPVVAYEVLLAVQSLVARAGHELHEPAWDGVLRVVRALLDLDAALDPPNDLLHARLHALITSIEQLHEAGTFAGCEEALLELVDACGHARPEASTLRLVTLRAAALRPAAAGWPRAALQLLDKYVRGEPRLPVRLHALHALLDFVRRQHAMYDEALERVGLPALALAAADAEAALRAAAAEAAPALAGRAAPQPATELVDLLERVLSRPFEMFVGDVPVPAEPAPAELAPAAAGLLRVLHERLLAAPAAPAARAAGVLLDHLDTHYKRPALFQHHPHIRLKILEMVFGLRVNAFNCVGFCYDASGAPVWGAAAARLKPVCSPYLVVEAAAAAGAGAAAGAAAGACVLPAGRVARALTTALTRERDWTVLGVVLRALPALLHARALAVGRRAHELDLLAGTLCAMLAERAPAAPAPLSEFHAAVLGALAALPPHHAMLEPPTQQRIVRCLLRHGMVLRSPQPYIAALTVFTLEMRDTMVKMLPEVLLDLSKISDTAAIASPMLEFLSTLTRLPRVFASFVEDQYMSVFAILLPYTNPSRYNHYVVSLAHHVIAAWFLKCRLSYRKNFVRFIIHGLHNYIIMPFEEQLQYKSNHFQQQAANEDSSNRQRSSSLGSKAVSRAPWAGPGAGAAAGAGAASSALFHVELTETCVDLLARYASSPVSVKPRRAPAADFLLAGGPSATWLVGHKLVTVTTAGCAQNTLRQGLCDRCSSLCRLHADSVASPLPPLAAPAPAPAPAAPAPSAADDLGLDCAPQVLVDDPSDSGADNNYPPEVKRYSKYSLQHSRSAETSCSSLSMSDAALLPPSSGHTTRQNSSENKPSDPVVDVLNQFSQRFDRISKEIDLEESSWSRVGGLAAGGGCPCWCSGWAELTVRSATGDVSWLMRTQNMMSWDYLLESPLAEVAALLSPSAGPASASASGPGDPPVADPTDAEDERRAAGAAGPGEAEEPGPSAAAHLLHKSSSDSVVTAPAARAPPAAAALSALPGHHAPPLAARVSTQPINIPGSPQRQSSSSTTDDDDLLLVVPEGKSRHPVRRSNSSPEMSSSWKLPPRAAPAAPDPAPAPAPAPAPDHEDMILLPSCEPTDEVLKTSLSLLASKKAAKRGDMRVSCEAIPEEMSGTSPLAAPPAPPAGAPAPPATRHPHLMTYNSDPGSAEAAAPAPHLQLQKTASDSTVSSSSKPPRPPAGAGPAAGPATGPEAGPATGPDRDDLPPLSRSKRSHTISVMSPTRRHRESTARGAAAAGGGGGGGGGGGSGGGGGGAGAVGGGGGGVTPAFVFLQLYHNMSTYPITPPVPGEAPPMLSPLAERPLRVTGVQHERTIKNLDLVPPLETYKVGVLYVGPGQQDNEVLILKNEYGSVRYATFLSGLGSLVALAGAGAEERPGLFLNLEKGGKDGRYTYVWHDDIMQVLFHVATAMPSSAKDPTCNEKRKYIGNDFVSIVYNDSDADFNIHTIKGQFNFCIVVVEPSAHGMNRVFVKTKDEQLRTKFLAHLDTCYVSDHNVALLARQLALHTALAAQIAQSLKMGGGAGAAYASNSLERLRIIKRLRRRLEAERLAAASRAPAPYAGAPDLAARVASDDFNHYT